MKNSSFIIFISIALIVYLSGNYYIFIRGWQSVPQLTWLRVLYVVLFITLAGSMIVGRFLDRSNFHELTTVITWYSAFWWSAALYFILFIALFDLSRLANHFFHIYPSVITTNYQTTKNYLFFITIALVLLINIAGFINAANPRKKHLDITIHKKAGNLKQLKIAMASDIHLGTLVGKNKLERLANHLNGFRPDVIILAGDIIDEVLKPVIKYDIGSPLRTLKAPLGVFGITGNHEYIGGVEPACRYIESLNIRMIRDSVVKVNNSLYLIGREDKSRKQFIKKERKELEALLEGVDHSLPLILLDHQPFHLEQAEKNKIDLQLSGHTHHGQFFPLNIITSAVYEVSWGYKQKSNSHIYVSSGYGTWGPPVRLGNRPEVVLITINFD